MRRDSRRGASDAVQALSHGWAASAFMISGRGHRGACGAATAPAPAVNGSDGRLDRPYSLRGAIVSTSVCNCALIGRFRLTPEGSLRMNQRS